MPIVTRSVPTDHARFALPLLRTPAKGKLLGLITSPAFVGLDTHFWKGHTTPCLAPNCEACEKGMAATWHGYLAIFWPPTGRQSLFEFTAQAGLAIQEHLLKTGTLRGTNLSAQRAHSRANSRVLITLTPQKDLSITLPEPPPLIEVLAAIWKMPADAFLFSEEGSMDTAANQVDQDIIRAYRGPNNGAA